MTSKICTTILKFFLLCPLVFVIISSCGQKIEDFYTSDIPLPEHPRPDFERELWINLNGEWEFAPDSLDVGEIHSWEESVMDSVFVKKILVPFSWASPLSGIGKRDFHVGWYARDILIPRNGEWKGKRIFLVIGACDFTTTVFLNGKLVGEHEGGYTPFEFDLTDFIQKRGLNRLAIRAEDMPVPDRLVGKQVYGEAKGIWQTVYLEGRSVQYIKRVHFTPNIDNNKVSVTVYLPEPSEEDLILSIAFKDEIVETVAETFPAGQDSIEFDIAIPNQRLWSPDDPFLYEIDIALDNIEEELDRVYSYFGMRKIGTTKLPDSDDMYITLNNRPVYLKMALDQSYHPLGFYSFPTDDFMIEEILRAKNIGLNGLRIHIKTEIPRKLYWADRLGLLIQADIPNIAGEPDNDAQRNWMYTAQQQILRDYNHPSIFSWVLFNETWGLQTENVNGINVYLPKTRKWVKSLYYWAKELDTTRLVEDNSPNNEDHVITDINSWHSYLPARRWSSFLDDVVKNTYPGSQWNYIKPNKQTDVPMMNSECGAVWGYRYGTGDIDISYEYHIMINEFRRRQKIAGFIFTEFHDVINEWNGYYRYDRSMKEFGLEELCPGMTVNDFHSDIYIIPGKDFEKVVEPGSEFTIPITASFMTDLSPSRITVKTLVHGWNRYGEYREYSNGEFTLNSRPYHVFDILPVRVTAPEEECLAVFCTYLVDNNGQTVHHNFVPFRVIRKDTLRVITVLDSLKAASDEDSTKIEISKRYIRVETPDDRTLVYRQSPSDFSNSSWSVMQKAVMDSMKIWGTGTGFFEYEFPLPENYNAGDITEVEFLAELSARQIQGKDMAEGQISRQSISNITRKGIDPGYSPNSYPMTDGKKHSSTVTITLNDQDGQNVQLEDDPADHRGLLSWINQIPGEFSWTLDEAGSYGYLVRIKFSDETVEKAVKEGVFRIKLAVNESSENSGGLAVYGEHFGRYPFDPTIIMKMK
ncbi:glycoside hydrolase family 2 protein [Candidatus Latescibacterota bacterium]